MAEEFPKETRDCVTGPERRDINARAVAWFGVGLIITFAVIFFSVRGLLNHFSEQQRKNAVVSHISVVSALPPEPRLQSNPASDLVRFQKEESASLNSYGWIDRRAGVVRIPVERSMDILAQRGLPTTPISSGKTPLQMRQEKENVEKTRL